MFFFKKNPGLTSFVFLCVVCIFVVNGKLRYVGNPLLVFSFISRLPNPCMKSLKSNDKQYGADSIESAVHGLVEEFFEMLGQGEAGSSMDFSKQTYVILFSAGLVTFSSHPGPQAQMQRIQSLLC